MVGWEEVYKGEGKIDASSLIEAVAAPANISPANMTPIDRTPMDDAMPAQVPQSLKAGSR